MSLIYLDNSATSFPKAPGVAEAVYRAITKAGTSGRASYDEALFGSRIIYTCRENLAKLFSIKDSSRIILNSGTTESLNTVIQGSLKKGGKVLTSQVEHNSVMRVLNHMSETKKISIDRFTCLKDGTAVLNSYKKYLDQTPDLVVLCHSSNVTGAVFPVKEMIDAAHKKNIPVCLDGAQSAGFEPINLEDLQADFFCFSGHKGLMGPQGTGGFYLGEGRTIEPLIYGGTGSRSHEEYQPEYKPDRFESGTRNISGIAGLAASVEFLLKEGIDKIREKEQKLTKLLFYQLNPIEGITIHGPQDIGGRNSVLSFTHNKLDVSEIAELLDEKGIAMRMGLHCSPSAHKTLGTFETGGTIRLSPGYFNSEKDIMETINVLKEIIYER
ncbi:MAG: aminotransferase class V-fold PLP-dependent enzyme [Spirochaetaceae bacterium]|jgi:cysteine desulfurase family protein|nr:aminotransferase class V-fold PLP-dependent enzyme [Spirochaetaceae bacterium]